LGTAPTVAQAALNNALWCASVLRARGQASHFAPTLWWSVEPAPPLYPRAVTLAPALDRGATQRLGRLQAGDAVKDSFACLPQAGFEPLFEATWFWRDPGGGGAAAEAVTTPAGLAAWVTAWGEGEGIFAPALLQDPTVTFLSLRRDVDLVAGCVLNEAAGVMGLSNVFGRDEAARAEIVDAAVGRAGLLPLVGYEAIGEQRTVRAAGFRPLGPLRVLLKT